MVSGKYTTDASLIVFLGFRCSLSSLGLMPLVRSQRTVGARYALDAEYFSGIKFSAAHVTWLFPHFNVCPGVSLLWGPAQMEPAVNAIGEHSMDGSEAPLCPKWGIYNRRST